MCVFVCMLVYFSYEEEDILPFVTTWMDLKNILLSEDKLDKDQFYVISPYEKLKKQLIKTESKMVVRV